MVYGKALCLMKYLKNLYLDILMDLIELAMKN